MAIIYHIASSADWEHAQRRGEYRTSTRGRTIDQDGFIHASTANQVETVANALYSGASGLVVLLIDTARLDPEVRYESAAGSDEQFPHIYGPLNIDAVINQLPFAQDDSGSFNFHVED